MVDARYLKFYGCSLYDCPVAGTVKTQMVDDLPDMESYVALHTNESGTFFFPNFREPIMLDGIVKGNFKITNPTAGALSLTSMVLSLARWIPTGTYTIMKTHEIESFSTSSIPAGEYINIPFLFPISKQVVYPYEKLMLVITIANASLDIACDIDTTHGNEFTIELPIASEV